MSKTQKRGDKDTAIRGTTDTEMPSTETSMDTDARHIEQIRDIILGRQMSDYEKRLKTLENRINNQIGKLRTYTDENLKAMKEDFQDQHAALSERLQREKDERGCTIALCLRHLKSCLTGRNKTSSN